MDQFPGSYSSSDFSGGDNTTSNYSYGYGIYASCDKGSDYIRAYDEETRHLDPETCPAACAGCDPIEPADDKKKSSNNKPNLRIVPGMHKSKESFVPQYSPTPPQYYLQAPSPSPNNNDNNDNNEKFNIVIIVLLAFIVLILLMNNNKQQQQQNIRYVYLPQNNGMFGNSMFPGGTPLPLPSSP
jgi:hypothetical protein